MPPGAFSYLCVTCQMSKFSCPHYTTLSKNIKFIAPLTLVPPSPTSNFHPSYRFISCSTKSLVELYR